MTSDVVYCPIFQLEKERTRSSISAKRIPLQRHSGGIILSSLLFNRRDGNLRKAAQEYGDLNAKYFSEGRAEVESRTNKEIQRRVDAGRGSLSCEEPATAPIYSSHATNRAMSDQIIGRNPEITAAPPNDIMNAIAAQISPVPT